MGDAAEGSTYATDPASEAERWRMGLMDVSGLHQTAAPRELRSVQAMEWRIGRMGPRMFQYERQRDMLLRMLADPASITWSAADMNELAVELGSDAYWGWELNVVADVRTIPAFDETRTFRPGLVQGRAYLYSFPLGRIVCVGEVMAMNREEITLRVSSDGQGERQHQMLNDDLENSVFRAAVPELLSVVE